jgi:hypothetical protein
LPVFDLYFQALEAAGVEFTNGNAPEGGFGHERDHLSSTRVCRRRPVVSA